MKPLLIKIDNVAVNVAHAGTITKELPLGTRPGNWYSVKTGTFKHLIPEELFTRIRPSLLESGWVAIEVNHEEHLLNAALVYEVTTEAMAAYGGSSKKYVFYQGRGRDRVEILSVVSPTDPLEDVYYSAVPAPAATAPVAEKRKYTIAGFDRFGRRGREVQVDVAGQRCG